MNGESQATSDANSERLRQAALEAQAMLSVAADRLRAILKDELILSETPLEAEFGMQTALEAIKAAQARLRAAMVTRKSSKPAPGSPTHRQGQFLAYIREYMTWNGHGIAPTHAELAWYFQLAPPSVNNMLKRLEERGFVRRIPSTARAIELTIDPELIPPLERPFKLHR